MREGVYICEKNGDYDDTRRDRCDRQGMRGAAHQPAGVSGGPRDIQASVLQVEALISRGGRGVAGPGGVRPDDAGIGGSPVRSRPEDQGQTREVSGAGEFPDGGDPHVLRFGHAHPGGDDGGAPARDNIGGPCLVWTAASSTGCTTSRWTCARASTA